MRDGSSHATVSCGGTASARQIFGIFPMSVASLLVLILLPYLSAAQTNSLSHVKGFDSGRCAGLRGSALSCRTCVPGTGVRSAIWCGSREDAISSATEWCVPGQPGHSEPSAGHLVGDTHHSDCRRAGWPFQWAKLLGQSSGSTVFLGACGLWIAVSQGRGSKVRCKINRKPTWL